MSSSPDQPLTLMVIFAHPDDETFGIGGTIARYGADPDVRVVLICATRGEAGEISDPKLATPARLGEVREAELRCACRTMGVDSLHFLGYRDSGMVGTEENMDPRALTMADPDEAVGRIVTLIRHERRADLPPGTRALESFSHRSSGTTPLRALPAPSSSRPC